MYAFVTLKSDAGDDVESPELVAKLRAHVRSCLGPFYSPDAIHWAPQLPKTRSGKIMRRVLRKIAEKGAGCGPDDLGDTSTLADPGCVDLLVASHPTKSKVE